MLAAVPKNAVTVDARVLSQICIKVNTCTRLPNGAEKDTDLHETTHRQLLWELSARLCLQSRARKEKEEPRCSSLHVKKLCFFLPVSTILLEKLH